MLKHVIHMLSRSILSHFGVIYSWNVCRSGNRKNFTKNHILKVQGHSRSSTLTPIKSLGRHFCGARKNVFPVVLNVPVDDQCQRCHTSLFVTRLVVQQIEVSGVLATNRRAAERTEWVNRLTSRSMPACRITWREELVCIRAAPSPWQIDFSSPWHGGTSVTHCSGWVDQPQWRQNNKLHDVITFIFIYHITRCYIEMCCRRPRQD